jgi:hypothetical protein
LAVAERTAAAIESPPTFEVAAPTIAPRAPIGSDVSSSAFSGATASLLGSLSGQLGISQDQAASGVGALMGVAQNNLADDEWSQLSGAVPGMDNLLTAASPGLQQLDSAAEAASIDIPGLGSLGQAAQVTSAFNKLGIDPALVSGFVPPTLDFVQKVGGDSAMGLLQKGLGIL